MTFLIKIAFICAKLTSKIEQYVLLLKWIYFFHLMTYQSLKSNGTLGKIQFQPPGVRDGLQVQYGSF